MKKISKFLVIFVWITLIYILFRFEILTGDIDNLNEILFMSSDYKKLIFLAVASIRVVTLIPSSVFMILGGMIFNPVDGVILTLLSILFSESIVYIVSKIFVTSDMQNYFVVKYPRIYEALLKNNSKILTLGVLCPIAPSDVICFLASSTGLNYGRFILIVLISNIPMMMLYVFLGNSALASTNTTIMVGAAIIMIGIYSSYLWKKQQKVV
ncbi:TVP38/TMEM64 family protein [Clostridium oceanicum]|uniref:TVP38/TMEM64 family membrane protein n=1 Tax=Clostridium oceanicum TaxID=1543 RepID=A0ABN1JLN2_9CLOT